jgi:hypothetical protein
MRSQYRIPMFLGNCLWVPRQMLGAIEQRHAVENVKVGINGICTFPGYLEEMTMECLNS